MPAEVPRPIAGRYDALFDRMSLVLNLLVFAIVVLTYRDYGITWDESYHLAYGDHIFHWYASGFEDTTAITYRIDYLYGGGFDLLGSIFRRIVRPMEKYQAIHLMGALIGGLGVVGTWKLGRVLAGPRAGFFAALMMALTSVYWGHMFNNPKDLPFAVGYAWGLYYLCKAILEFPRVSRQTGIPMAVAFGLAMSVRIGGLLLPCYLAMAIVVWVLYQMMRRRSAEVGYAHLKHLTLRSLAVVAGAWAVMLVWWPWALLDPIKRPIAALVRMSQFIDHRRKMPFAGEWVSNLEVPPDYLLHYFGYKLPELVLALFVVGMVVGGVGIADRARHPRQFRRSLAFGTLGFSILFPPAYAVYKESVLYDGLRHFLFLVPPLVAVAAATLESITRAAVRGYGRVGAVAMGSVVAAFAADQLATSARMHPHQYVYFNRFIGGLAGADGQYSTDYYGETYKEVTEGLADALWREEPKEYLDTMYGVKGCIGKGKARYYLPANFFYASGRGAEFDFHIGYTRQRCHLRHDDHPIIYRVERDGGLLNVARDMRKQIVPTRSVAKKRHAERRKKRRAKPGPTRSGTTPRGAPASSRPKRNQRHETGVPTPRARADGRKTQEDDP